MIRCEAENGWVLIPQNTHAWLAGAIVQHWGNTRFEIPRPRSDIALAVAMHDSGWLPLDSQPSLNGFGEPLSFLEPELDEVEEHYFEAIQRVLHISSYAGLLVNKHIQMIFTNRAKYGRDPLEKIQTVLDHLIEQSEEIRAMVQEPIAPHWGEDSITHNYRILRACDLLSLYLCGAFPAQSIPDVPVRYGEDFTTLECTFIEENTLQISPNPLNVEELDVQLEAHYVQPKVYRDVSAFRAIFEKAPRKELKFRIVGKD